MTGQQFREYRIHVLKLSTGDLADRLGVTYKTIYNWEKMVQVPKTVELSVRELLHQMSLSPQRKAL